MENQTYAILISGGKQYKVIPECEILVDKLFVSAGEEVRLSDVLFVRQGEKVLTGKPLVKGVEVVTNVVGQERGPKIIVFKKRSKKGTRKKQGHRQDLTRLKVKEILVSGDA